MSESEEVPEIPMDNCMHCQKDYPVIEENACLQIFLKNPECNYVQSICPHCDGHTRMFAVVDTICSFLNELSIFVYAEAPDNIKASWRIVNRVPEAAIEALAELPDLPPQLRRELYDYFRDFDHGRE
jgi:hypothetical protein